MAKAKGKAVRAAVGGDVLDLNNQVVPDYVGDTKRGSEGVKSEDLTLPRLELLQSLSPQVDKDDPAHIPGAEPGMMMNSVNKKIYGDKVVFIPVFFRKEWLIWKDRDSGGGFKGAYASERLAQAAMAQLDDADDCDIQDTAQQFGLLVDPESTVENVMAEEIVLSMSRTKLSVSRELNSLVMMDGRDRFSRMYEIGSIGKKNPEGKSYKNFTVRQLGFTPEALFQRAEAVYEAVKSGVKDVSRDDTDGDGKTDDDDDSEY